MPPRRLRFNERSSTTYRAPRLGRLAYAALDELRCLAFSSFNFARAARRAALTAEAFYFALLACFRLPAASRRMQAFRNFTRVDFHHQFITIFACRRRPFSRAGQRLRGAPFKKIITGLAHADL